MIPMTAQDGSKKIWLFLMSGGSTVQNRYFYNLCVQKHPKFRPPSSPLILQICRYDYVDLWKSEFRVFEQKNLTIVD